MTERVQAWRSAAFAGLTFSVFYSAIMALLQGKLPPATFHDLRDLLLVFLGNALMFGLIIGVFLRSPIISKPQDIALSHGETLIHSGLANHFLNSESRGGRLALTTSHLRFVPHGFNLQRSSLEIPLGEIIRASPVRIFKVFSNGLAVVQSSGRVDYFVVSDRLGWLDILNAKRS